MLRTRASIVGMMWTVCVAAVGLAALKANTDAWSGTILLLTCGAMALGLVGVACDAPVSRRWWVGFTVFGLGYLFLAFCFRWERFDLPPLATDRLIEWLGGAFGSKRQPGPLITNEYDQTEGWPFARIGHCLLALVIGTAAGILARCIFPVPAIAVDRATQHPEPEPAAPHRWTWALGVVLAILYAVTAVVGMKTAPVLWAGTTVLLTWAVLGLVALSGVFSRGRRRARRLGALLFGAGYLVMVSWHSGAETWAEMPGNRLLGAVRSYLPDVPTERRATSEGIAGANARLLRVLDQPIRFNFPEETPLEDALHYVSTTVRTPDGLPLPIYVDPVELQTIEKTLRSPVTLVLDGVPVRSGLQCLLEQVFLTFKIKGGLIWVARDSAHQDYIEPAYEDPLLLAGHCLLALAAAGLGGLLAPLVCGGMAEPECPRLRNCRSPGALRPPPQPSNRSGTPEL